MKNILKRALAFFCIAVMMFSSAVYSTDNTGFTASAAKAVSIKKSPTLKKSKVKSTTVTLKWSKAKNATSYRVYKSTDKKNWTLVKKTKKTSYTVKKLKSNKKYYFKVRAYSKTNKKHKKSPYSKVVSVKTKKATEKAVTKTDGGIKLKETTSKEAEKIAKKYHFIINGTYEGTDATGKTLVVYKKYDSGWRGFDSTGATYDEYGVVRVCPVCNKILGRNTDMCNGGCVMEFH